MKILELDSQFVYVFFTSTISFFVRFDYFERNIQLEFQVNKTKYKYQKFSKRNFVCVDNSFTFS